MGFTSLFGGAGYYPETGTRLNRAYPAAARDSGRVGDEMPYARVFPEHLLLDLPIIRARAKWLTRANPYAGAAARDLATLIVGSSGILPGFDDANWKEWRETPEACDWEGMLAFYALQHLAVRAAIVTGEAFVVRRRSRTDSRWRLPVHIDVWDGDALAYGPVARPVPGNRVSAGIEYGRRGRRVAYHFRTPHPAGAYEESIRVPADDVVHLYDPLETGMQRGVSWFTPVVIRLADLEAYHEASLKKADIAAKVAVVTSKLEDSTGSARMMPGEDGTDDRLVPGYELPVTPGSQVTPFPAAQPDGLREFTEVGLQAISVATGTGFELLTGDYRGMPFSASRMSRGERDERVKSWRARWVAPGWRRVYEWVREAAALRGIRWPASMAHEWPAPPAPAVEPDKDVRTSQTAVRSGFSSLYEELRRRGVVPAQHLQQLADEQKELDRLGLVLDVDPRRLSGQGQAQHVAPGADADGEGTAAASADLAAALREAVSDLRSGADDLVSMAENLRARGGARGGGAARGS